MTTTVKKGTGRPAAAARRTKAAQQAAPTDNLDSMSLTEVRQLAVAQGWSTGTKGTKKEIIALLRKHPDGPPKSASNGASKPATKAAPKVRSFRPITEGLSGDGASKAACVARLLEQAGWKVTMPKGGTSLKATRGKESLIMAWTAKGRHSADDSSYRVTEDSKPRRVINVATGLRFACGGAS